MENSQHVIKISFSQLSTFITCPFKHHLLYKQGLKIKQNQYMVFGKVFESAVEKYLLHNCSEKSSKSHFKVEFRKQINSLETVIDSKIVNDFEQMGQVALDGLSNPPRVFSPPKKTYFDYLA